MTNQKIKYQEKVLDVGCGNAKTQGSVGIDQFYLPGVDVVCDLNKSWPFRGQSFDKVISRHSLTFVEDVVFSINEMKRVTKSNGEIVIVAPHFSSDNAFTDPTSKHFLGYRSMDYFCKNKRCLYKYYSGSQLIMQKSWIHLYKSKCSKPFQYFVRYLVYPLEALINAFPRIYEKFFCFLIRANEIEFKLKVE